MPVGSLKPRIASLKPVGKKLLVLRLPDPPQIGGIWKPDSHREVEPARGIVREVGYGVEDIKSGDKILYRRELGYAKAEINGETLEVVPTNCVFAAIPQ